MFAIYGKNLELMKRFSPMNINTGVPVVNKIHATLLTQVEALKVLEEVQKENVDWLFEIRKL